MVIQLKKKDGSNSIESNLNGKFLDTFKVRRNYAPFSHIHNRLHYEIISKLHHECEWSEHYSLYSECT